MKVVIINCFDTYEERVCLLKKYFDKRGDCVRVITSNFSHVQKKFIENSRIGYEVISTKPYYRNISVARLFSHHDFAKKALLQAADFKPDLVWILVPPNSLVKYGALYKERNKEVKLIFDFIDMWPETMPIAVVKNIPPLIFWKNLRDNYVNKADFIVTECDLYQTILKKTYSIECMKTLYLARNHKIYRPNICLPKNIVSLCYLGSINNLIDIKQICEIIRSFSGEVELHIIGDGEKRNELISSARASGAKVIFHGKIYKSNEKKKIFDKCHFGLNIMKKTVFVGLTMKSIDYFEAGLPIINNIKGDTWNMVEKFNLGYNCKDKILEYSVLEYSNEKRKIVRKFFEDNFTFLSFEKTLNSIFLLEGFR